jgi:hypothetical protein
MSTMASRQCVPNSLHLGCVPQDIAELGDAAGTVGGMNFVTPKDRKQQGLPNQILKLSPRTPESVPSPQQKRPG